MRVDRIVACGALVIVSGTARADPLPAAQVEASPAPFRMPDLAERSAYGFDLVVARTVDDDDSESAIQIATAN